MVYKGPHISNSVAVVPDLKFVLFYFVYQLLNSFEALNLINLNQETAVDLTYLTVTSFDILEVWVV
jgi:hypothetical protein